MVTRRNRKVRSNYRTRTRSKGNRVWTREEIAFLRKYYRNHETQWVARQLGRTVYSVRYKASDLNIRKANPSSWKTPTRGKVSFGYKPSRRTRRTRTSRWSKTRRNNRRTRW
jgi:hypothetical protein